MKAPPLSLDDIRAARRRAASLVKTTPLDLSATLSTLCGRAIYLKLENLQKTGSFKVRGALNKLQGLDADARARGVITASAGNHAQGVAYAGQKTGVGVTVVMPESASLSKVNATEGYGAEVVLEGKTYADAYERAVALAAAKGATFVHAFDDAQVIAGQGTLGLELLEQLPDADTIVVPVGGGGLIAGIIAAVRGAGSRARILGVQSTGAAALRPSLRAGKPVPAVVIDTIADGLATGSLGMLPFELIRSGLDDALEVSDAEIAAAIVFLLERAKTVVEGAAAVGIAAALAGRLPAAASKVVVVITGGNIDTNLLDRIINLGLVTAGRLFRFETRLVDRPGELLRLLSCLAACHANIHQIRHERARPGLAVTHVAVSVDVETRGLDHVAAIERAVTAAGFVLQRDGE
jgi:threonine dehydratase